MPNASCIRPIVTPPRKPKAKKEEKVIRCPHCNTYSTASYCGNYCSIMCFREAFFGFPQWQDPE